MDKKMLWKANLKCHKGGILGIFLLILLISVSMVTVMTLWYNADRYVNAEMDRLGFGDITAWVSGIAGTEEIIEELLAVDAVEEVRTQNIIYAEYEVREQESDSEGQLILYAPDNTPYKIFLPHLSGYSQEDIEISPGAVYVSPSMRSMFGVEIGDEIQFPIARNGVDKRFVVKGYFEDPFMGSSMMGMKSFLICWQDYSEIAGHIAAAGINALARTGYMLHISQPEYGSLSAVEFSVMLNENSSLPNYVEFAHSHDAIAGFMLTLQNIFTGLMLAFVCVLIVISLFVLSYRIGNGIEQDTSNMGILKSMGFTTNTLRIVQLLSYGTGILLGMAIGMLMAVFASRIACSMTVDTTGIRIPSQPPVMFCMLFFIVLMLILLCFIWCKTGNIGKIAPVKAIYGGNGNSHTPYASSPISSKYLSFWIAVRQLVTGKKQYVSVFAVSVLLVFFVSMIGRIHTWLGPDGEGLMNAFNPADLHIAAQSMGETDLREVERTIEAFTPITDRYMLAMPNVAVNGMDYTANVITEPERFHLLRGRTCTQPNEVVLTEFVASDLGVWIGDTVTVEAELGREVYTVSGIYQCANDMGGNIGMSKEGYALIGRDTPQIWCSHYFLENADLQPVVMQALEETYRGGVYFHENSWPGLNGILSAMNMLILFMYVIAASFILIVTALTGSRVLADERRDMGIYKVIGFTSCQLRIAFLLRFFITAFIGAIVGTSVSAVVTDDTVSIFMGFFGISHFNSHLGVESILIPAVAIAGFFAIFSWLVSEKIKKASEKNLILE